MRTIQQSHNPETKTLWIRQPGGHSNCYSDLEGRFTIIASGNGEARKFSNSNSYSAAMAFIKGEFDVRGDIFEAIRHFYNQHRSKLHQFLFSMLIKSEHLRVRHSFDDATVARNNIQFHYDLSNEFYAQFLDSRMIYSAALFADPDDSLEKAQTRKLDSICKDLVLRSDEQMLDIGCGWGGLICYAAGQFGTRTRGCTLSRQQFQFANQVIEQQRLNDLASVELADYRAVEGPFDKIASVGMFEHVGPGRLPTYFNKMFALLRPAACSSIGARSAPEALRTVRTLCFFKNMYFRAVSCLIWMMSSERARVPASRPLDCRTCGCIMHEPVVAGCRTFSSTPSVAAP